MSNKQNDIFDEYRREVLADDPWCSYCNESPGRIYNNADITSGQWVPCDHDNLTYEDFKEQVENLICEIDQGPVDLSDTRPSRKDFIMRQLLDLINIVK